MAATVRVEVDIAAFNLFRNSAEVTALCEQEGQRMAQEADQSVTTRIFPDEAAFRVTTVHKASRVAVYVATNSEDGRLAEATHRALTRAMHG